MAQGVFPLLYAGLTDWSCHSPGQKLATWKEPWQPSQHKSCEEWVVVRPRLYCAFPCFRQVTSLRFTHFGLASPAVVTLLSHLASIVVSPYSPEVLLHPHCVVEYLNHQLGWAYKRNHCHTVLPVLVPAQKSAFVKNKCQFKQGTLSVYISATRQLVEEM